MTRPAQIINCGGSPRCGRCTRCRQIEQSRQSLDPTERLLNEAALAGPKLAWGPDPLQNPDARRRKANLALEKLGLRPPLRW